MPNTSLINASIYATISNEILEKMYPVAIFIVQAIPK